MLSHVVLAPRLADLAVVVLMLLAMLPAAANSLAHAEGSCAAGMGTTLPCPLMGRLGGMLPGRLRVLAAMFMAYMGGNMVFTAGVMPFMAGSMVGAAAGCAVALLCFSAWLDAFDVDAPAEPAADAPAEPAADALTPGACVVLPGCIIMLRFICICKFCKCCICMCWYCATMPAAMAGGAIKPGMPGMPIGINMPGAMPAYIC